MRGARRRLVSEHPQPPEGGRNEALEGLAVELLARGLSVRDIEDAFRDVSGGLLLSRTAVGELWRAARADYQDFASRDLSEYEIVHLFVDGIAQRIRPGQRREPVMAAWGYTMTGSRVLLHLMAGSKEDAETGERLLPGHARPRVGRPAPGRVRRRAPAPPGDRDLLPALRPPALPGAPHAQPRRQGPRGPMAGVQGPCPGRLPGAEPGHRPRSRRRRRRRLPRDLPSAVACFEDDFGACIAHLRMPVTHRRAILTTNLLERLFFEERRRLKISRTPSASGPCSSSCSVR